MTRYKLTLSIGLYGNEQTEEISIEELGFTQEVWDNMSDDDKEKELNDYWQLWVDNYLDGGWHEIGS